MGEGKGRCNAPETERLKKRKQISVNDLDLPYLARLGATFGLTFFSAGDDHFTLRRYFRNLLITTQTSCSRIWSCTLAGEGGLSVLQCLQEFCWMFQQARERLPPTIVSDQVYPLFTNSGGAFLYVPKNDGFP